jgi:hypothetical protein
MALGKRVKIGGSYYKGYELIVGTTTGDSILDMVQDKSCAVNSFSATPDAYGVGDYMSLKHITTDETGKTVTYTLAETIYVLGASISVAFDFVAFEQMKPNDTLRLTYTKVDGATAVNVHTIVEYGGVYNKS